MVFLPVSSKWLYYSSLATYALNMLSKGITTIFVTDMDRSNRFYTETLGLRLAQRFGNPSYRG